MELAPNPHYSGGS